MGTVSNYGTSLLVLINTVFGLVGLLFLVSGGLVRLKPDLVDTLTAPLLDQLKNNLELPAGTGVEIDTESFKISEFIGGAADAFLAVGGVLVAVVAWAYMGTCCRSRWMLIVYAFILSVLLLAEVAFVVIVIKKRSLVDDRIKASMRETISRYYEGTRSRSAISMGWNAVMALLHCCGVDGPEDFRNTSQWDHRINFTNTYVDIEAPLLCCQDTNVSPACSAYSLSIELRKYNKGCYSAIWDLIGQHQTAVIGVLAGVGAFQVILLILTICIIRDYPSKNKVRPN